MQYLANGLKILSLKVINILKKKFFLKENSENYMS